MQINTNSILLLLTFFPLLLLAQKTADKDMSSEEYISMFKNIAIQEMERSGIPASITLAQGIHESAFGNSTLARQSKNHFGIKCTSDWKGETTLKWDDEANKSCFRVYSSAEDSYVDHTDFLLNRKHYAFLFEYDRKDYKGWAKGLRKAGYATDPLYPEKLIATIDKYKLFNFDKVAGLLTFDTTNSAKSKDLPIYALTRKQRTKPRSFLFKAMKPTLYHENGTTYAVSRKGESALAAANRFGIPYKRFLKLNDLEDGDLLMDYQPVYIDNKKNTYKGEQSFYKVENDVTMYEIAQRYALKLSSLLVNNLLKEGEEPKNGEMIMLKEKALTKPKLRPSNHLDTLPSKYIDEESIITVNNTPTTTIKATTPIVKRPKPEESTINTPTYSPVIYADTAHLNTSKSTDKDYLEAKITPDETTNSSTSTTDYNPYATNNTFVPVTSDKLDSQKSDTIPQNTDKQPDNRALFNPYNSNSSTINSSTTTEENNKISSPRIKDSTSYGSTKNNNLPNPTVINTEIDNTNTANSKIHVVQKGETLYKIYKLYNIPVATIQKVNNLVTTTISIGDRLIIPSN